MRRVFRLPALLAVAAAACESDPASTEPPEPDPVNESIRIIGGARPATMIRPQGYVAGTPWSVSPTALSCRTGVGGSRTTSM